MAAPSLMMPDAAAGSGDTTVLAVGAVAALVAMEYGARSPGLLEFREAPPYNRIRLAALAAMLVLGALAAVGAGAVPDLLRAAGAASAHGLAVPGGPVAAALAVFPAPGAPLVGLCAVSGAVAVAALWSAIRSRGWPAGPDRLNLWLNLPTFDATRRGGLERRLRRLAWVNLALGVAAAYASPTLAVRIVGDAALAANDLILVWAVTAWALVPTLCAMRALALFRVAALRDAPAARAGLSALVSSRA